jgi:hypothetical protein
MLKSSSSSSVAPQALASFRIFFRRFSTNFFLQGEVAASLPTLNLEVIVKVSGIYSNHWALECHRKKVYLLQVTILMQQQFYKEPAKESSEMKKLGCRATHFI